ncbi:hypothetical protein D3C86_1207800 [compost metagenome]
MKRIGPSFLSEVVAAGVGEGVAWNEGGDVFFAEGTPEEQRATVLALLVAHDPVAPEPTPVPRVVSRWQGREAMRITEWGETDVISAVEAVLADPATPAYYRTAWDELQQFELDSPMLIAIADVIGMTQAQRYDMFRLAYSLRA